MVVRIEQESIKEEKRSGKLVGAAETSKGLAGWSEVQRKNLSVLGQLKQKEWPRCHKKSCCQVRRSRLCQKEKKTEPSVQITKS